MNLIGSNIFHHYGKVLLFGGILTLCLSWSVQAQGFPSPEARDLGQGWVELTVFDTWQPDTPKLRTTLRKRAEIEMLDYKGLLKVDAQTFRLQSEGIETVDLLTQLTATTVSGRVDSILAVDEAVPTINNTPYLVMRYRGHVLPEEPDLSFKLKSGLNQNIFMDGEALTLTVHATQPAHLIVFDYNLAQDRMNLLYPFEGVPYSPVEPQEPFVLPPADFGKKIRVYTEEAQREQSMIFVVATRKQWVLPSENPMTFDGFLNWLGKIPLPMRALASEGYSVVQP